MIALASELIASLDEEEGVEEAWAVEIERRAAEIDAGEIKFWAGRSSGIDRSSQVDNVDRPSPRAPGRGGTGIRENSETIGKLETIGKSRDGVSLVRWYYRAICTLDNA